MTPRNKGFLVLPLIALSLILSGCGNSSAVNAAISKACGHFDSTNSTKDIFGMEKDFAHLARLDIRYFRLSELATEYITEFHKVADSLSANRQYPEVPRVLMVFCENG